MEENNPCSAGSTTVIHGIFTFHFSISVSSRREDCSQIIAVLQIQMKSKWKIMLSRCN